MKYKKTILFSVIILGLIILLGFKKFNFINKNDCLTLNEALRIASNKATEWDSKSVLLSMTSVDNPALTEKYDGHDGKRRYWNFQFAIPNTDKLLLITIHDGQVISSSEVKESNINENLFISQNEIKLTSQDAIKKCSSYFNIKPGVNWAAGYHFTLDKVDGKPILSIVCSDKEGYFSTISFNAKSGELISAQRKVPNGGGLYHDKSKVNLNENELVSTVGITKSPNFLVDKTMISWYLTNPLKSNMSLVASITNDGGITWNKLKIKDDFSEILFSDSYSSDKTIYAITSKGLTYSKDSGNSWNTILSSESPVLSVSVNKNKILAVTEDDLQLSSDKGKTWNRVDAPQNIKVASLDSRGNIILCSNNELFKENNKSWVKIKPPFTGEILGMKADKDYIFVYTNKDIGILKLKNNTWKVVSNLTDIQTISVSSTYQDASQLYVLSAGNMVTRIRLNKDLESWISEKINLINNYEGEIVDLVPGTSNSLYICTGSNEKWEKMKRGK